MVVLATSKAAVMGIKEEMLELMDKDTTSSIINHKESIATLEQLSIHNLIIVMEEFPRVNGTLEWDVVIDTTTRTCIIAHKAII
eukprot:9309581-Ditylum_brightwellii.AAC.1